MSDLREALQEAVEYLNGGHGQNSIGAGSILHRKMQAALSANGGEPPSWTAEDEPVAYLTWQQVRHAIDDYEEVVAISHKDDRSADGTPAFPVYTHPAPPSVAVPEEIREMLSPDNWGREGPAYEPYDKRTLRLSMDQFDALQAWLTAAPPPDHSGDSNEVGAAPASFGSARELADWLDSFYETLEDGSFTGSKWDVAQAAAKAVRGHGHIADAGKVVPIGYLTNQAVARLQSDKRLNGEHLYAFKPDDMSKFQAVYLGPAVKDSLTTARPAPAEDAGKSAPFGYVNNESVHDFMSGKKLFISVYRPEACEGWANKLPLYAQPRSYLDSEDQKGMERIVEAVAHIGIDFGYGTYELEQCHIDRAREIKESLDRLGSDGG